MNGWNLEACNAEVNMANMSEREHGQFTDTLHQNAATAFLMVRQ
jgi:hypothetical protein